MITAPTTRTRVRAHLEMFEIFRITPWTDKYCIRCRTKEVLNTEITREVISRIKPQPRTSQANSTELNK